jgi:hypothetical protein
MTPQTPQPPPRLPHVAHGTLSGYLMERSAGVDPCTCCLAALADEVKWCEERGLDPRRIHPGGVS